MPAGMGTGSKEESAPAVHLLLVCSDFLLPGGILQKSVRAQAWGSMVVYSRTRRWRLWRAARRPGLLPAGEAAAAASYQWRATFQIWG